MTPVGVAIKRAMTLVGVPKTPVGAAKTSVEVVMILTGLAKTPVGVAIDQGP
jgi:hypothetical protein